MSGDNQITWPPELLAECGIRDAEQAQRNLGLLCATLGSNACRELLPGMLSALTRVADPDLALNNLERFTSALGDVPSFIAACRTKLFVPVSLLTIFGASRFLSTYLVTIADESLKLLSVPGFISDQGDRRRLADHLVSLAGDEVEEKELFRQLRIFRKQQMLRIGLRDLLGKADLRETVEALSDLAEVCLQRAYEWVDNNLRNRYGRPRVEKQDGSFEPAGFAVIAMGKLGGRELNFSSDVDLMYVYTADGETEGTALPDGGLVNKITNHEYFIKLSERITAAIGEKTGDGFVFRVDLRLRPEGQRGPIAQSLSGYEIYYESWGQTWERSALIKARPVAGDASVGREFVERIAPFVYRKYLDFSALGEIGDMKMKINKEVEKKGKTHRDVKLGYGGIREIEFVVQALQLVYAGRDRSLREKTALRALHLLSQKGLLSYQEQAELAKAYIFLRTVEHRIQILDDQQTQTFPSDEQGLRALARRFGFLERGKESESLLQEYARHTERVRSIYDNLFAFREGERTTEPMTHEYGLLLEPDMKEREAVAMLGSYGFRDPGKAYRDLVLLREGPAFVHQTPRSRKLFEEIFPPLFKEIVASHDPDAALNHLESFLAAQDSWDTLQSIVKIDVSAVKVLIAIFANSEYLSRMLVGRPALLRNLLESRKPYGVGTRIVFSRDLAEVLDSASDISEKLDTLRRFKHREEIRIGMADLLSNLNPTTVSRDLSKLAEVCLEGAFGLAGAEMRKRYGNEGPLTGMAIIGVGKLGGRELSYGSDLDILFVYRESNSLLQPSGMTVFEYFSKVAEKMISFLSSLTREGFVFRIDTRLRPAGSKGPLVQSIGAFINYYTSQAETWERQALLRARYVAGDRSVAEEFCRVIQDLIYRDVDRSTLAADIRSMRRRMEEEVGQENAAHYNIKQGEGGLVDIEFIVQYLQLLHGQKYRRIRVPGTLNAIRSICREGLLNRDDCELLRESYQFLRQLESKMRIVSNQATSKLVRVPDKLWSLARRMRYADAASHTGQSLLHEYEGFSRRVREVFDRILGD